MAKRSSTWDRSLRPFRSHIIAQGEVLYAYNLLHDKFFSVLLAGLSLENPDQYLKPEFYSYALAIWNISPNDRLQRELALTTISNMPTSLQIAKGIECLAWAKDKTNRLVEYRNLIAHTPFNFVPVVVKGYVVLMAPKLGGMGTKTKHHMRLMRIKDLRFWKSLRNDFLNLSDYVEAASRQIWRLEYERVNGAVVGAHRAWPGRPRLRCLRLIEKVEQEPTTAASVPRHRARRRPSPPRP